MCINIYEISEYMVKYIIFLYVLVISFEPFICFSFFMYKRVRHRTVSRQQKESSEDFITSF